MPEPYTVLKARVDERGNQVLAMLVDLDRAGWDEQAEVVCHDGATVPVTVHSYGWHGGSPFVQVEADDGALMEVHASRVQPCTPIGGT